ncbi:hypothetical protein KIN20_019415 [Parelaphostrongylus tenuis]|uniref:Uncharacterized protein n=1 Tax=Parelaphostrongylus tenuis TaxID=148309 RepID=A0AAD5QV28_PARTN|nr:hypothetical protein KIN20_019415 [Parelaphostrongylus tenuis]
MAQAAILNCFQNAPPAPVLNGLNYLKSLGARGLAVNAEHRGEFAPPSSRMDVLLRLLLPPLAMIATQRPMHMQAYDRVLDKNLHLPLDLATRKTSMSS